MALAAASIALAACKKQPPPPPPIRPVLSILVAPYVERTYGFTGSVEARYRINLGFRVLGRLISREVEVGDRVKAGDQLASIEALALELAVRSAIADVSSARAQVMNTSGAEARQQTLLDRNVVAQSQFDSARQAQDTALASVRRAEANLDKASKQLTYARLRAEMDGVVTAVGAQVGQVVASGQPVVTVARPDIREAAVDVPEEVARDLKPGTAFDVALQLDPSVHIAGEVREVGPLADAATRTRHVLISLPGAADVFRLGTTITARLTVPSAPSIELPRAALLVKGDKNFVWIVDPATTAVTAREIMVAPAPRDDGAVQVTGGLAAGARVVIAGVHDLTEGQRVRVPGSPAP